MRPVIKKKKLPESAEYLKSVNPAVKQQLMASTTLRTFLDSAGRLSLKDRRLLVEQALVLLEMLYVHLPLKRAMHAVDPIQRLKLLKLRLAEMKEGELPSEIQFHDEMQEIFTSTRDLHTNYLLPSPFNKKAAYLPFLIEEYFEKGANKKDEQKFLVSHLLKGFKHPTFKHNVEVLYWNGVPIKRAIEINGENQAGSNLDARFACGLDALTIRPMVRSLPPDEEWVIVTYRSPDGQVSEIRHEWLIFTPKPGGEDFLDFRPAAGKKIGIDIKKSAINHVRKILFAPEAIEAEKKIATSKAKQVAIKNSIKTSMPDTLRAKPVMVGQREFAYIRIFNFEVEDADKFVQEFARLASLLPQDGLIIDVRGNGGGNINAGEQLLQLLTPNEIQPELFELVNTPLTLEICRMVPKDDELSLWAESIAQAVTTGAAYSVGFPLTPKESCNAIGQTYYGPVVLIIDALCYSTTDMFTAGFQDHKIGKILGTSGNTGAGGANVWEHGFFLELMGSRKHSPFKPLPKKADMRIAFRRSIRIGEKAGTPLEELGVIPDKQYHMTKEDLVNHNIDLMNKAGEILSAMPVYKLSVQVGKKQNGVRPISATTGNISRLDVYVDDRPQFSLDVVEGENQFELSVPSRGSHNLIMRGYDHKNDLVAALRRKL